MAARSRIPKFAKGLSEILGVIVVLSAIIPLTLSSPGIDNYLASASEEEELFETIEEFEDCVQSRGVMAEQPRDWKAVDSFAYQLQEINFQSMAKTKFDLVIIDYSADGSDEERFSESQIRCLQDGEDGRRLALAYISIGEAEDYRWYWQEGWDLDHDGNPEDGAPSWLGPSNPEWFGNYKVKYWDPNWKSIVFVYIDKIIEAGFDGIYLDIIDAYEYWGPDGESGLDRASAEQEMVDFVIEIANYARQASNDPEFGVFPQNGDALASHPEYIEAVTGIGREDLWYLDNTLQPSDVNEGIANLDKFREAGKLVLVTDYPTDEDIINDFYSKAVAKGYVPYAAVRDLDELIERYPPENGIDRGMADSPEGVKAIAISNLVATDLNGIELEAMTKDSLIVLEVTIQNNDVNEEQPFLLILEVRDRLGVTTSLQFQSGTLNPDSKTDVRISWMPEQGGSYEIRSFAINSLEDPEILSPVLQKSIEISE